MKCAERLGGELVQLVGADAGVNATEGGFQAGSEERLRSGCVLGWGCQGRCRGRGCSCQPLRSNSSMARVSMADSLRVPDIGRVAWWALG